MAVMMSGVPSIAYADTVECVAGDECPNDLPWDCSSICSTCPCSSVVVPSTLMPTHELLAEIEFRIEMPNERAHCSAPPQAGIFRPPRT